MLNQWLATLERRYARYAFRNITYPLVGAMALMFVLLITSPNFIYWVTLDRDLVLKGQVWRLVTFAFIPPTLSPIWIVFSLFWTYTMGVMLEQTWGSFRYQVYWFLGWLSTLIVAMITGEQSTNAILLESVFLAFATIFPDYELRLFFVIPVKVKWLAWLSALGTVAMIGLSSGWARLLPAVALGNYLLFFGKDLIEMLRRYGDRAKHAQKFGGFHRDVRSAAAVTSKRVCASCGVTDADPSIDFRVCTCDKCKQPTTFCLKHARDH